MLAVLIAISCPPPSPPHAPSDSEARESLASAAAQSCGGKKRFYFNFFFCVCRYFCSVPQTLAGQKGNLCVCVGEATLKAQKPVNQEKAPSRGAVEAGSPRAGADSLMAPPQLYFGFFWRGGGE